MSQHADITKELLAKAVKFKLSHEDAADLLQSVLYAAGYEDKMADRKASDMHDLALIYLRSQKDGLYGVSHEQIDDWALYYDIVKFPLHLN
jgi:20S proteasome alpha/beta subunit